MADPAHLRQILDGRWWEVRERVRRLSQDELFRPIVAASTEEHRERIFEQLKALSAAGLTSYGFPVEYGGQGDLGASITAFDMLAMGDLSLLVKTGVQFGLFGGAVLHLGTSVHHERYLADIAAGRLLGCFAMTELGHGSDVAQLLSTASYDPSTEEFVVSTPIESARKEYIGNAARDGQLAVVFAQLITEETSHGVHAFLVPIRTGAGDPAQGVRIADSGPKAGLNGVDNGSLWFDEVRIPRQNLLNRYADVAPDGSYTTEIADPTKRFFTMLGTLIQGRISVAGGAVSATKVALTLATRYAEQRTQFAAPGRSTEVALLDYLAHQRKLLPLIAKTYALHFAQNELVERLHEVFSDPAFDSVDAASQDPRRRELEARAAGVKATVTWHATRTIQVCREACGGAGYLAENRLADLKADTDVFTTFEGDNTILLQLVAKELLTGYRDHFGDLDLRGVVAFAGQQAFNTVLERTAARPAMQRVRSATGSLGGEDWADRDWHISLFEFREHHSLAGLAKRLRKVAKASGKADSPDAAFTMFNACQDHLLMTARAHIDRVVLGAFVAAITACEDAETRALLNQVCDLWVLTTIEDERAWFIEHGRLSAVRTRQLGGLINRLLGELRPRALELVAGFGIPSELVAVPMLQSS